MKDEASVSHKKYLLQRLQDKEYALIYLNESLREEEDKRVFLLALRNVAEAQGGITKLANLCNLSREHLYRMLSGKGNPELKSLKKLLSSIGFKLAVEAKSSKEEAA